MSQLWTDVRLKLLIRRLELSERVRAVAKDLEPANDSTSADWTERAMQRSNDEALAAIGEATTRELAAIDLALQRTDSGIYAVCIRCGRPIAPGRLRALPHVAHCENCAD
jgi:DnaK suppressor protein